MPNKPSRSARRTGDGLRELASSVITSGFCLDTEVFGRVCDSTRSVKMTTFTYSGVYIKARDLSIERIQTVALTTSFPVSPYSPASAWHQNVEFYKSIWTQERAPLDIGAHQLRV